MADIRVAVAGAGGRMGAANIRAIVATPGLKLAAAFDRPGSPAIGKDAAALAGLEASGVLITDDVDVVLAAADAVIDFTAPGASVALAEMTAAKGLIHIIGTTGCSTEDDVAIRASGAKGGRIVKAGNFSLGLNILASLVKQAAAKLAEFDIEIIEMHHNRKVDAPSGTALMLGEAAAAGREISLADHSVRVRDGITGPRVAGTIGFATLRGGNVIGDHTVILAGPSERLELSHIAQDRSLFANGAVKALLWVASQQPGFYTMNDVLGLN
ncbi:4-hydroxy-tetrahydrodipicolinate reductase [Paradevosia shaoguanensis]|uniref:4-hydroxy-tetrahydrodipicolinate reductase n=1 Tax=Paradevosia shaoguanensis TaxID=1335043 RepID=UPI003C78DB6C